MLAATHHLTCSSHPCDQELWDEEQALSSGSAQRRGQSRDSQPRLPAMKSEALHGPFYFLHDPHFSGSATPTLHPTTPARFKVSLSCHFFFLIKCSIKKNHSHTFLGRGVFKMDKDSVMQSTISSAASALLRQKTIASPISFFLGVSPRRISSNLSLCLNTNFF